MKIGVLGGTFDPIHVGHLMLADQAIHQEALSKVLFVPSYRPPHKAEEDISTIADRIEMIKLAIEGNGQFELSTVEQHIPGKGYTYKTLEALRREYGPETEIYFVVGSDVLKDLENFKNAKIVFESCSFIAAIRPGDDEAYIAALADSLSRNYHVTIRLMHFFEIGISSSLIRDKIAAGGSVRYLLPDSVIGYIERNKLFS